VFYKRQLTRPVGPSTISDRTQDCEQLSIVQYRFTDWEITMNHLLILVLVIIVSIVILRREMGAVALAIGFAAVGVVGIFVVRARPRRSASFSPQSAPLWVDCQLFAAIG